MGCFFLQLDFASLQDVSKEAVDWIWTVFGNALLTSYTRGASIVLSHRWIPCFLSLLLPAHLLFLFPQIIT